MVKMDFKNDSTLHQKNSIQLKSNIKSFINFHLLKDDPDYENAKRTLASQKVRFNDSADIYLKAKQSALNFSTQNSLYSNPKTNQYQVEDYNSMRKTKSSLAFQNRHKPTEMYDNLKSYQLNGDILNTSKGARFEPSRFLNVETLYEPKLDYVENYVAADGTQYKIYNAPSGHTVKEVDCPTRNIIHVPGKYHEHYRSTLVESEVPQNIKHKFRTIQTNELLKDQLKVHDTLSHIQNSGIIKKNDKTDDVPNLDKAGLIMEQKLSDYYDLGNHLRHAISHGFPTVLKKSHTVEVHNENVSKEFLGEWEENVKGFPWRRRKDWIGKC